jgi:hypothetical protein
MGIVGYTLINSEMKFRNKKKFQFGILAHFEHCVSLSLNLDTLLT